MPYKSRAQAAYFNIHKDELERQGVNVDEWNSASKGMKLPKHKRADGGGTDPDPMGAMLRRFMMDQIASFQGGSIGEGEMPQGGRGLYDQFAPLDWPATQEDYRLANRFHDREIPPEFLLGSRGYNLHNDPNMVTNPDQARRSYGLPPEFQPEPFQGMADLPMGPMSPMPSRPAPFEGMPMRAEGGPAEGDGMYSPYPDPSGETLTGMGALRTIGHALAPGVVEPPDFGMINPAKGSAFTPPMTARDYATQLHQGLNKSPDPIETMLGVAGGPSLAGAGVGAAFRRGTVPTFYSGLERAIENSPMKTGTPGQWLGTLKKAKGTRPEEFEWTGLENYLNERNAGLNKETQVSKNELLGFMRQNKLDIKEEKYGLFHPGHEERSKVDVEIRRIQDLLDENSQRDNDIYTAHHRAMMENPDDPGDALYDRFQQATRGLQAEREALYARQNDLYEQKYYGTPTTEYNEPRHEGYAFKFDDPGVQEIPGSYGESVLAANKLKSERPYRVDSHWRGVQNPLAHSRASLADVDGERTLVIQELQSDIHNAARSASEPKEGKPGKPVYRTGSEDFNIPRPPSFQEYMNTVGKERDPHLWQLYKDRYNLGSEDWDKVIHSQWLKDLQTEQNKLESAWSAAYTRFQRTPPDAPMKGEQWIKNLIRNSIRQAAENGATQVMIPDGLHQAEMWQRVQRGNLLNWEPHADPEYFARMHSKDKLGNPRIGTLSLGTGDRYSSPYRTPLSEAELRSRLGKNLYERLMAQPDSLGIKGNKRLETAQGEEPFMFGGHERMRLYNEVAKNVANDVLKPFGQKVAIRPTGGKHYYTNKHQTYNNLVFKVTPEMAEHALNQGWPFKRGGSVMIRRAAGGPIPPTPNLVGNGLLHSSVPGRTDDLNISVPSGAYVIPADIVAGEGQGNTIAGSKKIHSMFSGPMGLPALKKRGKSGAGRTGRLRAGHLLRGARISAVESSFADGGAPEQDEGEPTPILAAGGEYIVHPHVVRKLGRGDLKQGHQVLDAFVLHARKQHIKQIKNLKPPVKT